MFQLQLVTTLIVKKILKSFVKKKYLKKKKRECQIFLNTNEILIYKHYIRVMWIQLTVLIQEREHVITSLQAACHWVTLPCDCGGLKKSLSATFSFCRTKKFHYWRKPGNQDFNTESIKIIPWCRVDQDSESIPSL